VVVGHVYYIQELLINTFLQEKYRCTCAFTYIFISNFECIFLKYKIFVTISICK